MTFAGLVGALALTGPASADGGAAAKPAAGAAKSLDEGRAHLNRILGAYDPEDQMEWRLPVDVEHTNKGKPPAPDVLISMRGWTVIGQPFREAETVCFDEVSQWERHVYDLAGDRRTLTRTQRSHNVTRYLFTLVDGVWVVHGQVLSNGVHRAAGKPAFSGTVKWHPDGFELVGFSGIDQYYAPGGQFQLGAVYRSSRYRRDGDRLLIRYESQSYHLATAPGGAVLPVPDFQKPFGSPYRSELKSEPMAAKPAATR